MTHKRRILLLTTPNSYRTPAFLDAAQRLGIDVLQAVDMPEELSDHWGYRLGVPFHQVERAAAQIVDALAGSPVDTVLAVDDSGALLAARASHLLGLPHNAPDAAEAARNKALMRQMLAAGVLPSPAFRLFSTADDPAVVAAGAEAEIGYPCVVKPVDLNGSRGVIRANDRAELLAALRRLYALIGAARPFLVESYIPGVEVALEGMLDNGYLTVLALFDKPDPLEGPFFEETIYVTPSRLPATTQQAIADCAARAARALGLHMGPIHAELRINDSGPWIVEVAGRSIGGLCSRTLRFGSDASLEELILRQACGLPIESRERQKQAGGVMMIPIPGPGILRSVRGLEDAQHMPGVESVEITARVNNPIVPLPEGESYLGFIFARGDDPADVERSLRQAHAALHFEIEAEIPLFVR
ncbi:MAG: ATP-grasp domain-containing protein [Caldilineaceae bacterium]|nr:ATP-grasp domain-containing protein [Caldilineaceae bacterium]